MQPTQHPDSTTATINGRTYTAGELRTMATGDLRKLAQALNFPGYYNTMAREPLAAAMIDAAALGMDPRTACAQRIAEAEGITTGAAATTPAPQAPPAAAGSAEAAALAALRDLIGPGKLDESAVRRIVAETAGEAIRNAAADAGAHAADKLAGSAKAAAEAAARAEAAADRAGRPVVIEHKDRTTTTIAARTHEALPRMIERIRAGFSNLYLVGPAGTGKTTIAKHCAEALGLRFSQISVTPGTTEGQLLGRLTASGEYLPAPFVEIYEKGGLFLLDEIDAADPGTLCVLNSALANGRCSVPNRIDNPVAERHPDTVIIAAANTYGTGASAEYVGRSPQDAAAMDRYTCARFEINYDAGLERSIMAHAGDLSGKPAEAREILSTIHAARENIAKHKIRRVLSTRTVEAASRLHALCGMTPGDIFAEIVIGWTPAEISKAGFPTPAATA